MTKDQLTAYKSAISDATAHEMRVIDKGNEMLSEAGMPPLTPDQAKMFLTKQRERHAEQAHGALWLLGAGGAGFMLGRYL